MRAMTSLRTISLGMLLLLGACGGDKKSDQAKDDKQAEIAKLTMPPIGVDAVKKMNYVYGDASKLHAKCVDAYKKKDWAATQAACEAVLAKDAGHLDAERVLATALAQQGNFEGTTPHLVNALAGDFLRWGPKLPEDKELADYLASPHGKALIALHLEMKAKVEQAIAKGVWVIGRRSTFKWPAKSGGATTRGELYAWTEDDRRFLRITHTDHQLAAWLPAPTGDEIALIGYDKAELPDAKDPKAKTVAPTIRAWVQTIDGKTFEPRGKRAVFKAARAVSVTWGPGGQLLVTTMKAQGRWGMQPGQTFSIDETTGKTAKTKPAQDPASGKVMVSLDESVASAGAGGLKLTPSTQDPSLISEITFSSTNKTIGIPQSGVADGNVPRANPSGSRVAFAAWADPCSDDAKPTLYVADAKTGDLKHVLTAGSRFNVRWLTDDRLLYEDGTGGLRVWDAATGREADKVADKAGFALAGLSASPAPICHAEPLADVETGGEEVGVQVVDELPPEETEDAGPPAPGPVTAPQ
jgi:hypothetical protein